MLNLVQRSLQMGLYPAVSSSSQTLCNSDLIDLFGGLWYWLTMSVSSGAVRVEAVTGSNAFIERLQWTLETGNTAEQLHGATAATKPPQTSAVPSCLCVCVCVCLRVWVCECVSSAVNGPVTFTSLERFCPLCWIHRALWASEAFKGFPETSQLQKGEHVTTVQAHRKSAHFPVTSSDVTVNAYNVRLHRDIVNTVNIPNNTYTVPEDTCNVPMNTFNVSMNTYKIPMSTYNVPMNREHL